MPVARYILLIAVALVVLPAAGATQEPDAIRDAARRDAARAELIFRQQTRVTHEQCEADPRYLLVTVVSGTVYTEGEPRYEFAAGPHLLDLCVRIRMFNHEDGTEVVVNYPSGDIVPSPQPARVTQFSPGRMRLVVRETLAELCRAMSSCAVVSDRPVYLARP